MAEGGVDVPNTFRAIANASRLFPRRKKNIYARDKHSGPERRRPSTPPMPQWESDGLSRDAQRPLRNSDISSSVGGSNASRIMAYSGPANAKYTTIEARLRTFKDWPPALRQQPQELAEAGFYYIGLSDQVKCFHCDGGLRNWQSEDDPWVEHARWFSKCAFLHLVKGAKFVQDCLRTTEEDPEDDTESDTEDEEQEEDEDEREDEDHDAESKSGATKFYDHPSNAAEKRPSDSSLSSLQHTTSTPTSVLSSQLQSELSLLRRSETSTEKLDADLEQENRRLREQRLCKICMDREIGVVFLPCGHLICCVQCAPALKDCPLCRQPIHGTVKTYMS